MTVWCGAGEQRGLAPSKGKLLGGPNGPCTSDKSPRDALTERPAPFEKIYPPDLLALRFRSLLR